MITSHSHKLYNCLPWLGNQVLLRRSKYKFVGCDVGGAQAAYWVEVRKDYKQATGRWRFSRMCKSHFRRWLEKSGQHRWR
ncbi:hypothetical protein M0657_003867 [Pyricularia oryzae]|nr:hypothetical protein M9X92_004501 [Pyricularia oryzae]KAI7926108.1 hypothetical protein M0657_003867 [Pyricularia oryzae]QBZ66070.1 hypothetical protein PoMZ_13040 [Pyricularia oryzae]